MRTRKKVGVPSRKRVGVPLSEEQVSALEALIRDLRGNPQAWDVVLAETLGVFRQVARSRALSALEMPPGTLPQLLAVSASIGLRVMQDAVIDARYQEAGPAMRELFSEDMDTVRGRRQRALALLSGTVEAACG